MRYRSLTMILMLSLFLGFSAPLIAGGHADDSAKTKKPDSQKKSKRKAALKVGEDAPLFKLNILDSEKKVDLKGFVGKRPVILFFGSYT